MSSLFSLIFTQPMWVETSKASINTVVPVSQEMCIPEGWRFAAPVSRSFQVHFASSLYNSCLLLQETPLSLKWALIMAHCVTCAFYEINVYSTKAIPRLVANWCPQLLSNEPRFPPSFKRHWTTCNFFISRLSRILGEHSAVQLSQAWSLLTFTQIEAQM